MLMMLVPLFDENMAVKAYSIFSQKDNYFLNPMKLGTSRLDGSALVEGLELIKIMGIETLSEDKEIFVPVSNISVFSAVEEQCDAPHERIVFLIDNTIPPIEMYVERLKELRAKGYRLAIRKLAVSDFENYKEILKLVDYVFLNNKKIAIDKAQIYFGKLYPHIKLCAGNIDTMEIYEELKAAGGYQLYEGSFYRVPLTHGAHEIAPLKINYIELLNLVNDENYELLDAASIIGRDPALTISLLKMVNRMSVNSGITTIRHAAAMLGQKDLRKWISTAVVNELYADKPNEVTRLSLLRAKFAENLAEAYGMKDAADELFLMGLFSVLDVILEMSMEEALELVKVSDVIRSALVQREGKFAPVYDMMEQYENANWQEVSRQLIVNNIDVETISGAYHSALNWYKELTSGKK